MEYTLSDKMNAIFNSGESIRFQNVVKKKDGEWYSRIIWEHVQLPGGQHIRGCEWWRRNLIVTFSLTFEPVCKST